MRVQKTKRRSFVLEQLETRQLLSGLPLGVIDVPVAGGTQLQIFGTAASEGIVITTSGANLVISCGGWSTQRTASSYKSILVGAGAGDDFVCVDPSVTIDSYLYGAAGNDTLVGGSGNDRIYGGAGNDRLGGRNGDDLLVSTGGGASDAVAGGAGKDSFWLDSDSSEVITDMTADESGAGAAHRVSKFDAAGTIVSKELGSVNLADPTLTDGSIVYRSFKGNALFADNGPLADDVRQGYLGDCYYLATLASIADVKPDKIRQSIADLGDGTYAVQFKRDGKSVFVRVDADLPTWSWSSTSTAYAGLGAQGSLWVAVMEKAYAFFRYNQSSYGSLEGGWMSDVYSALGSSSSDTYSSSSGQSLLNLMKNALAAGKAVTYACSSPGAGAPLIGSHAYTVDHVNLDANGVAVSVTLRNPWGVDGAGSDGANDGYVTITGAQALASFMGMVSATV